MATKIASLHQFNRKLKKCEQKTFTEAVLLTERYDGSYRNIKKLKPWLMRSKRHFTE